jgi:hypothetical protein
MSARAYGHRLSGGDRHKFSSGVIHSRLAVPGPLCGKISRKAEYCKHSIEANFGLSLIRFPAEPPRSAYHIFWKTLLRYAPCGRILGHTLAINYMLKSGEKGAA